METEIREEVTLRMSDEGEEMEVNTPKRRKINTKMVAIAVGVILVLALLFFFKGVFVAATVNGSPISRLSVIHTLEHRSGKSALEMVIVQKLITQESQQKGIVVSDEEINAEIKLIENQIAQQGGTLDMMLAAQGMSQDDLRKQIVTQKEVEKLLGDKVLVSDAEVDQFIIDQKVTLPKDKEAEVRNQIKDQLKGQKVSKEGTVFVDELRAAAKINYFVKY